MKNPIWGMSLKQKEQYKKFRCRTCSAPKTDHFQNAVNDSITKEAMMTIRKDNRTIKDDMNMHVWNKKWRG